MASDAGDPCSIIDANFDSLMPFLFCLSVAGGICIELPNFPLNSVMPIIGLMGEMGEEFRDTTDGGDVNEAGARIVIVKSSDVMFDAWRVKTWNFLNSYINWLQRTSLCITNELFT